MRTYKIIISALFLVLAVIIFILLRVYVGLATNDIYNLIGLLTALVPTCLFVYNKGDNICAYLGIYKIEKLTSKYSDSFDKAKNKVNILWIDDEITDPESDIYKWVDSLKKGNYELSVETKLSDVSEVRNKHIIICDYSGVGLKDSKLGINNGAMLMRDIQNKFPNILLIAFSGVDQFSILNLNCKFFSKSSFTYTEFVSNIIDKHIREYTDPKCFWKRMAAEMYRSDYFTDEEISHIKRDFILDYINKTPRRIKEAAAKCHKDQQIILSCIEKYLEL